MRNHVRSRLAACALATAVLAAPLCIATQTAVASGHVTLGEDWTAVSASGGTEVTLKLDEPLPMIDDAPTLVINGKPVPAVEAADGLSLSATVTEDAAAIRSVYFAWTSGDTDLDKARGTAAPGQVEKSAPPSAPALDEAVANGAAVGPYSYTEDDYDFGDQAIDLAWIGGIRGELTGRIYMTDAPGARPVVILLHGRHTSCSNVVSPAPQNPNRWPCVTGQTEVPSYKGYDGTGQTLASQGYVVVSISANAINANDNQLAADNGAQARGQLVLDTLSFLQQANLGLAVSFHDNALNRDLTFDQALDAPQADVGTPDLNQLDASNLVGRFDFSNIGLMGHSRGGEGVVSAVELNQALAKPFAIKSVLPLAPVDFGRMTVADTPMLVMLPYCDGDVSNQQGQHFIDDSRYAHDQSVLLSTVWVMGADHNFFNSVWTPGKYPYSTSDDWGATSTDAYCGPRAATNKRLTADQQYDVGTAYMTAWFRLTLGGETQFLPFFDGTVAQPVLPSVPSADIRALGVAPSQSRLDVETFAVPTTAVSASATSTFAICASAGGRTMPQELPACATANSRRSTSAMPHWTPASFAPNVPASAMGRFVWAATGDSISVDAPLQDKNASKYDSLTFKTAPDEAVLAGTDMVLTVTDDAGSSWSSPVSALNPLAISRMPISTSTTLNKIVLQQVTVPMTSMTGINTKKIASITFSGAVGADGTAAGGAYLSDLSYSTSGVGTPRVDKKQPTINVDTTFLDEGSGPATQNVAVYLSKPANETTTAWFSLVGSTASNSLAGLALQKVTFLKGETCVAMDIPTMGNSTPSAAPSTAYKMSVSQNEHVIAGKSAVTWVTIREDDGVTGSATALAPVGVQGDACAEALAKAEVFPLEVSSRKPATGSTVTVTATGYRAGEAVAFSGATTQTVIADASGTASVPVNLAATAGSVTITAKGAGSARVSSTTITTK
jgi:trimeric autotransporter adhesin